MEERIVVARSEVPVSCSLGNLIFERRYQEAIDSGLKLLEKDPEDCMIHINLMDAYFKGRALSPDYFDKSTYYAKQTILYGHNTGYAEDRLAKNLEKLKLYHQSLQLYDLILENKEFHFSQAGIGNKIDFARRRELAKKKMDKALDSASDVLFTPQEVAQIIQSIKDKDAREEAEKIALEKKMRELEEEIAYLRSRS